MKRIVKRRESTSPDVLALWSRYFDSLTDKQESIFYGLLYSIYIKGTRTIQQNEYTKYLSIIWPPKIVTNGRYLYPPSYRGNDYSDERSLIKGNLLTEEDRQKWSLDVIFPGMIRK